jgi:small subunit ribosomal protein S6
MSKYELVTIVDAALSQEDRENVLNEEKQAIEKNGGKIINSQVWMEKHKMTFSLKKSTHGTYHLVNFEGPTTIVAKIKPVFKLNERILRTLITKVD